MKIAFHPNSNTGWGVFCQNLLANIEKFPKLPDYVTLHAITGATFDILCPNVWDRINIGVCFIEDLETAAKHVRKANRFDLILAGSTWNATKLRELGVKNVGHFTQGVDLERFKPRPPRESDGRFIVFSGGKAEYRKGTDLVIAAMAQFMDKYPDVWLAAAWENQWEFSLDTLSESKHIKYIKGQGCRETLKLTAKENGIPMDRLILYPLLDNQFMPPIYAASDIGLFPNRVEAGNNMVMCEYMACQRPIVTAIGHGHWDVIPSFCLPLISEHGPKQIADVLDLSYRETPELRARRAEAAAKHMSKFTWEACVGSMVDQIQKVVDAKHPTVL